MIILSNDGKKIISFELLIPENIKFTDEQLLALCELNKELRIKKIENVKLIIMNPSGGITSNKNTLFS